MKVCTNGKYNIYVYSDHPPPHCHVRCTDGSELVVGIATLNVIRGGAMKRDLKKYLIDNIDEISVMWEKMNPEE